MCVPEGLLRSPARGIGLLGGTFDPVHVGHIALAEQALKVLNLARIDFLPAGNPWQKHPLTPASDRVRMLELAVAGKSRFVVNLCEIHRTGPTYTVDTLRQIRQEQGPEIPLVLILGADQWENLQTWKDWQLFLDYADIAVSTRDGKAPRACEKVSSWACNRIKPARLLHDYPHGYVGFFSMPPTPASSSKIRTILRTDSLHNQSVIDTWLCPDVKTYIRDHHLYRNS